MVQRETGLPLYAHCRHLRDDAHRMLDIFAEQGADPAKTVLGHASFRLDADYLASLADRGCSLCIDQVFPGGEERAASAVAELVRRGYGGHHWKAPALPQL
jgi:phosphotriesterase-related protein